MKTVCHPRNRSQPDSWLCKEEPYSLPGFYAQAATFIFAEGAYPTTNIALGRRSYPRLACKSTRQGVP